MKTINIAILKLVFLLYKTCAQLSGLIKFFVVRSKVFLYAWNFIVGWFLNLFQRKCSYLILSPYRSIRLLFLFWIFGMVGVIILEENNYLVMSASSKGTYVEASIESSDSENTFLQKMFNHVEHAITIPSDGNEPIAKMSDLSEAIKLPKAIDGREYRAASEYSCKGSIKAPTFTLDLLFPIFKINQSSSCTLKDNAFWPIKFIYVLYPILGIILAGLTLFSWAGILQNRLSR